MADLSSTNPFTPKFDGLVERGMKKWNGVGLSMAVVHGEDTFSKGYGFATLPDISVTPETLFFTGSTTKAFTAAAASILIDEKKFKWSTPISELSTDFVLEDSYWTRHITVEDALCHRTGMPRHDKAYTHGSVRDVVRLLRHLPMSREPRTEFQYNNMMYIAVSQAIENVSGEPLGDYFVKSIWKPLGMNSTFFTLEDAKKHGQLARGYYWNEEFVSVPHMVIPEASGAGFIISNVLDYAKWIRAIINKEGPISKAGHAALIKPLISCDDLGYPMPSFYGLGWVISYYHGVEVVSHTGGLNGFVAFVVYLPKRSWGCVMMGNMNRSYPAIFRSTWYLIDELLGVPESQRIDWDAKNEESFKKEKEQFENAKELFPNPAKLPHAVPLDSYVGRYFNPGYQNIELVIKDGKLYADVDRTWRYGLDFEHISGEYFIVYVTPRDSPDKRVIRAEFVINASGKVVQLGLMYEETNTEKMIEFRKEM